MIYWDLRHSIADIQNWQIYCCVYAGLFWKGKDLSGIALTSASWGDVVLELGSPDFEFSVANAPPCSPAQMQTSLELYLQKRLTGTDWSPHLYPAYYYNNCRPTFS